MSDAEKKPTFREALGKIQEMRDSLFDEEGGLNIDAIIGNSPTPVPTPAAGAEKPRCSYCGEGRGAHANWCIRQPLQAIGKPPTPPAVDLATIRERATATYIPAGGIKAICEDVLVVLDELTAASERIAAMEGEKDDAVMSWECLMMVRDELKRVGCQCEANTHDATPPMMYPEWIRCAVGKREKELTALRAERDRLRNLLVGSWVDYDSLPYEMATPEYDATATGALTIYDSNRAMVVYQMDEKAIDAAIAEPKPEGGGG